jgi:AcrR family transcriptional regulator
MPRVSLEHEQAVRNRIIEAAIKVFGELGYSRASIQDVVRASGLSVGAVYTHFKGKEELFLVACSCEAEQQVQDLRLRLADIGSLPDRLRVAVDFAVGSALEDANPKSALVHAWARADNSPELQEILRLQRAAMVDFARRILEEAIEAGELPSWIDADGIAAAFVSLVNGFAMMASETGLITADDARRQAYSFLELLLAASAERPEAVARLRAQAPGEGAAVK